MSTVITEISFDAAGRLASDLPCRECHYNLRLQPADGSCTECGTAILASTHDYYLFSSDLDWLKNIRRGLRILLLLPVIVFVMAMLGWLMQVVVAPESGNVISLMIGFSVLVTLLQGIGLLTRPEPSRLDATFWTARQVLRQSVRAAIVLPIVLVALGVVIGGLLSAHDRTAMDFIGLGITAVGVMLLWALVWVVIPAALLRVLRTLAVRCPAPQLVKFTQTLSWITVGLYGATFLLNLLMMLNAFQALSGGVLKPVNVKLTTAQQETLKAGNTLLAKPADPNDPNGLYQIVADPQAFDPNPSWDPNTPSLAGSVTVMSDPNDPNGAVMMAAPIGGGGVGAGFYSWFMLFGVSGVMCLCAIVAVLLYVVLFPCYRNVNLVVKAIEARVAGNVAGVGAVIE